MSCWTHVAATFRIDSVFSPPSMETIYEIVGKPVADAWEVEHNLLDEGIDWEDVFEHPAYKEARAKREADWEEMDEHPERFLPCGSEGSLKMHVWFGPGSSLANCTVTVFGDLRDYGGYNEHGLADIEEWFMRVVRSGALFRQAVVTAEDEWGATITLTHLGGYGEDAHVEKKVYYSAYSPNRPFADIEWQRADIITRLKDKGVEEPTDEQVDAVIEEIGDNMQDRSTEFGWDIIYDAVDVVLAKEEK